MFFRCIVSTALAAAAILPADRAAGADEDTGGLVFAGSADNDLYRVAGRCGVKGRRYDTPSAAVAAAPAGAGVLILADGYPAKLTPVTAALFDAAAKKKLRVYVEYPAMLGGMTVGKPRRSSLERVVVASDVFGDALKPLSILAVHDCHFVPVKADKAYLVLGKVAGFDRAVFGLADVKASPILFEHRPGAILVCTTKLSQFVTARYATKEAIQAVLGYVLGWAGPGVKAPRLDWTPTVRPTYARAAKLPPDAARKAVVRGVDWHTGARMLMHASWKDKYHEYRKQGVVNPRNPVGPRPDPSWQAGDGEFGVLEGVSSRIRHDGTQPIRWWLRTDSVGESSLAFALRSKLDGDKRSAKVAGNLLDWVYVKSGLFKTDPSKANCGLIHWAHDSKSLYGDNDVKVILACMGTAAALGTDRWDTALVRNILGNFRTTGVLGFRGGALNDGQLLRLGWQHYWRARTLHYAPHYEAWIWATYLWLYDKTKYPPLLERTRGAIRMMMDAYPNNWRWTNGIQQERGRMLLTLAWLIRVDDRPQHRAWLKRMADDMRKCQDACGAIREQLGPVGKGGYRPPLSNAEYGRHEASLIQENGDPVADLLYTCNFAFLGLHEAHAATGDTQYRQMADRLAEFLVRVQVRSEAHPELDGGWFRAFDFKRWDYWGSNADAGWGAWSIEVGWTQGWICSVLALREMRLNLWDMTKGSKAGAHMDKYRKLMMPDDQIAGPKPLKITHAAVGKTAVFGAGPDPRYPGMGARGLTDGRGGPADHTDPAWLGYHGGDFAATVDLGKPTAIGTLAGRFLQNTAVGIYLPKLVVFEVSDDGRRFSEAGEVRPDVPPARAGPLTRVVASGKLDLRARYVRVRAVNVGKIPPPHRSAGLKAWLFVDELLVNGKAPQ